MDKETQTIYVYLENEHVAVWRPVRAEHLQGEAYRIVSTNEDPETEVWQFQTNDIVRCETKRFSEGEPGLVAVERLADVI